MNFPNLASIGVAPTRLMALLATTGSTTIALRTGWGKILFVVRSPLPSSRTTNPTSIPRSRLIYGAFRRLPHSEREEYFKRVARLLFALLGCETSKHTMPRSRPGPQDKALHGDSECYSEFHHCGNHVQHLISTSGVAIVKEGISRDIFCATMFLSQNLHFTRLQRVVQECVDKLLVVEYTPPPPEAHQYATCFKDFVIRSDGAFDFWGLLIR